MLNEQQLCLFGHVQTRQTRGHPIVIPPHSKEVSLTCLMDLRDKTVGPLSTEFPVDRMAFGQS